MLEWVGGGWGATSERQLGHMHIPFKLWMMMNDKNLMNMQMTVSGMTMGLKS